VDSDGTVYAGMKDHVEVYDSDGTKAAAWPSLGKKTLLTSIAVGERTVFVADFGHRRVIHFDKNGKEIHRTGKGEISPGVTKFFVPSPYFDLAVDDGDSVWVVDPGRHRLIKYRSNGDFITSWKRSSVTIEGFCGCCNPSHIALRTDGSFVTSEKGLERVKIHAPTGDLVEVVAGPEQFEEGTVGLDLAVDSRDRIFVLDPTKGTVRVFESTEQSE
jgi:sugar lactone lactonase YvrE